MFTLTLQEFDYTRGNENPLSHLSVSVTDALNAVKGTLHNVIIFNHNKKEFYISRTNVVKKHMARWRGLFVGYGYNGGIPDALYYSLTMDCIPKLCVVLTEDADATLKALDTLENNGWTQLSKQHKQSRMKHKTVNLYKVVDDKTGFSRYTLSAERSNNEIMNNVRLSTTVLSNGKRFRGVDGYDVIRGEVLRIAENNLYCKVKTSHVFHVKEDGVTNVCEKEMAKQVRRLNDLSFQDWIAGPYIKALLNKEGVLYREA